MHTVPLAILDRANTRNVGGQIIKAPQIFAEVTARAQHAEQLGFHRFWVAEHHSVPGIAGSAPTLLLPHLAEATSAIRLGTGGIMVPSHQPLVIAEQLGTLHALYGGRIDAGLGSSVGFTKPVRAGLRQTADAKEHFTDDVDELIRYLDGTADITAYPQNYGQTDLYVLTGGGSASFAASRGIGLVLGGPAVTDGLQNADQTNQVVEEYRSGFNTAARGQEPWVIASVNVVVAESDSQAYSLALSESWALARSRSIGVFQPLEDPSVLQRENISNQEQRRIDRALASTVYGDQATVVAQLQRIIKYTDADELMITGNMWDPVAQRASDRLLMEAWQTY